MAFRCACGGKTLAINTRVTEKYGVRRRRKCRVCGQRFTTYEQGARSPARVRDRNAILVELAVVGIPLGLLARCAGLSYESIRKMVTDSGRRWRRCYRCFRLLDLTVPGRAACGRCDSHHYGNTQEESDGLEVHDRRASRPARPGAGDLPVRGGGGQRADRALHDGVGRPAVVD